MSIDFETLGLTEIIRLGDQLSQVLARRFSRMLALAFSDIVGSTEFFDRFGNEEGRTLQQRHYDLVERAITPSGGRVVDTAGDGAFTCFPAVDAAVDALTLLENLLAVENESRLDDRQLRLRIGIHFGQVLTDGKIVTGDPVNLASRITSTCEPGEIRMSDAAFVELSNRHRLRCRSVGPVTLKGVATPVETWALDWHDLDAFPTSVRVDETGATFPLPAKEVITFGRLREHDGRAANDIVLELPDPKQAMLISRWQFELRRHPEGIRLRTLSEQVTEVDGQVVTKGQRARIGPGSVVRIGYVLTLRFLAEPRSAYGNETVLGKTLIDDPIVPSVGPTVRR